MINFPGWQLIPIALAIVAVSLVFLREDHFWLARLLAVLAIVLLLVPTALWLWGESWSPATAWLGLLWLVADFTVGVAALLVISSKEGARNEKRANLATLTAFLAEGHELHKRHVPHDELYDWKGRTETFLASKLSEADRLKFVDLTQRRWEHLANGPHNDDLIDSRQWFQNLQRIVDELK